MLALLDNPVWNGLNAGNSSLARGNEYAKFFDPSVSILTGLRDYDEEHFAVLAQIINDARVLSTVTPNDIIIPQSWKLLATVKVLQMVYQGNVPPDQATTSIIKLADEHVPQMMELTKLTNPGPFAERTIAMGNYEGIFADSQLVSMAGQRTQPAPYIEISAVCTRPAHLGKGYAGVLINSQIKQILAQKCIPFLHVRTDNVAAIKLYEKLGFVTRREMTFTIIRKK
jgi:predicted GNAT family acetyltransferase